MRCYQKNFVPHLNTHSDEPGTEKPVHRLARDEKATAGAAYALLLAAVVAFALAGATMLGSSMERALSMASSGMVAPTDSVRLETDVRGGYYAGGATEKPVSAKARVLRVLVFLLVSAVAVVLATVGWLMLRRPSKEPEDEQAPRKKPVEEKFLLTRLNAKRELLWKQLMADHDLLLKNQIEVRHVMTRNPVVVDQATPGKRIAELLAKHHVAHLIVCDDDKRLAGVVKASDHRANPDGSAQETMTPPPCPIAPKTTLGAAISLFIEQGVSFIPVVDQEKLCGLLTPTDLVLTLHCSLQLWFRVAQTMQTSSARVEDLEAASCSMNETADQVKQRVQRLPDEVKTAIQTGDSAGLVTEINEMTTVVSQLMQQLEDAQAQIRQQGAQIADLKDPSPDAVTGAASREELDRVLGRLLDGGAAAKQPLSLVLFAAGGYQRLRQEEGQEAADDHLRLAVECVAENIASHDHVARYRDDTLAIVLPGTSNVEARLLCTRLSAAASSVPGDRPALRPRMCIVSVGRDESASELLKRAEKGFVRDSNKPDLVTSASSAGQDTLGIGPQVPSAL